MTLISYAQNLEDVILFRALNDVDNGFYIDIGAYDPVLHSVTKLFYDRGWRGINVEPVRGQFDKLQEGRPRDINLNVAVAPAPGLVTLYEVGGLSTTIPDIAERHDEAGFEPRAVRVPALTLESVLASADVPTIHFLKIDIEGAEEAVITATRFDKIRPWIVVVEATAPLTQESTHQIWEAHLLSEDYEFIYFDGLNRYYLSKEKIELKSRLGLQPNIFDEYKTSEVVALEAKLAQGEEWRQNLIASHDAYKDLHRQFERLGVEAEDWRRQRVDLTQRQATLSALLGDQRRQLADSERREAAFSAQAASAELRLAELYRSMSWRLTAPLRGIAARNPSLIRGVRRAAVGYPRLTRTVLRAARVVWRLCTLRSPFPKTQPVPAASAAPDAPQLPTVSAPAAVLASSVAATGMPPGRVWFYLGDTIDWLTSHAQLTGVGRVTAELFFASLRTPDAVVTPCALALDGTSLVGLSLHDSAAYLSARAKLAAPGGLPGGSGISTSPPTTSLGPAAGDHVLFTGVVWSPVYSALFERLVAAGITFSVLVYDIIPLEDPEYVSTDHHRMFSEWLRVAVTCAANVFVSTSEVRDRILRWAALAEVPAVAQIVPIEFGVSRLTSDDSPTSLERKPGVRWDNFVLSVGTIDRRKNQAALCRLWPKLRAMQNAATIPQLVLAGRDDIDLAALSDEVAELIRSGDILTLKGLTDDALAALYSDCQFTAFPSLSEGHGLPVAESLMHGKVCVASDLAVIREHAGDLPWYVPPGDDAALLDMLHRAITDTAAREEAERDIARTYRPVDWSETWQSMHEAVHAVPAAAGAAFVAPPRPDTAGIPARADVRAALRLAQRWCTESEPDVSILIINWHAAPLTMECIRQIWANTEGVRYEIVVVDNGSDPASLGQLRRLGRGVRLLELGANRFFGEANNIAAEHAKGRFVCLLNNDAFVQPGWLKVLREALDKDEQAGAAGPLFLFPDGSIQEAGGTIDSRGVPQRAARGEAVGTQVLSPGVVDYISAAALLVRANCFEQVGGFDLAYEPAYYEDVDLCFKLRAIGRPVLFCPTARVVHIEGAAANDNPAAIARRNALGDLNRDKFTARWSKFLETRNDEDLKQIAKHLLPATPSKPAIVQGRQRAALFTPYALTPGGGERFLLTIASILAEDHDTTIVTRHPYSQMRLRELGRELGIDLGRCHLATEAEFLSAPSPQVQFTMSNHIAPPIEARGENSFLICQFPFPLDAESIRKLRDHAGPYRGIITYSDYARAHALAAQSAHQMPVWPIEILYPPVPQYEGDPRNKRRMILTVGRFFKGGHAKRHDLMIEAFRRLLERSGQDLEMHICGSSVPDPVHMGYLSELRTQAANLPITFHVNASQDRLAELYRDAAVYWHATGLDAPLVEQPWAAEHFGITVLEAMSAGCVPMVFNAGGPREIVTSGVDGFLFQSLGELVESAAALLSPGEEGRRETIAEAAARHAAAFRPEAFRDRVKKLLDKPAEREPRQATTMAKESS